jgi:hypothetical protein
MTVGVSSSITSGSAASANGSDSEIDVRNMAATMVISAVATWVTATIQLIQPPCHQRTEKL